MHGSSLNKKESNIQHEQNGIIDIDDDTLFDDNITKLERITEYGIDDDFEVNDQKRVSRKHYISQWCI